MEVRNLTPERRSALLAGYPLDQRSAGTAPQWADATKFPSHIQDGILEIRLAASEKRAVAPEVQARLNRNAEIRSGSVAVRAERARRENARNSPLAQRMGINLRHGVLCVRYPNMPYDVIKRAVAENYSEDTLNRLYAAIVGRYFAQDAEEAADERKFFTINADTTYAIQRELEGMAVRFKSEEDDEDDFDDEDCEEGECYHRQQARAAKDCHTAGAHYACADAYTKAKETRDPADLYAARIASRKLRGKV